MCCELNYICPRLCLKTHLSGSRWGCICWCFVTLCPFVGVFYATEQALFNIRRPVLWSFHLDQKDTVWGFINVGAPFEPNLFLGKNHVIYTLPVIIVVVTGSALQINLPYVRVTLVVPPLWKNCSDTDEEHLPKVDVRKPETARIVTEKNITESIMYLHAHTDT